jgi:hypothetical protein
MTDMFMTILNAVFNYVGMVLLVLFVIYGAIALDLLKDEMIKKLRANRR